MTGSKPPSLHPVPERVIARIFDHVDRRGPDECWPWTLSRGSHGYGQVGWWAGDRSAMTTAHRVVWIAVHGPIPDGMTVDHRCRFGQCCNPRHLRLRTNLDNARDNRQALRGRGRRSWKEAV